MIWSIKLLLSTHVQLVIPLLLLLTVRDQCHNTRSNLWSCPILPHHNIYINAVYAKQEKIEICEKTCTPTAVQRGIIYATLRYTPNRRETYDREGNGREKQNAKCKTPR
jgi:hypothetical protein